MNEKPPLIEATGINKRFGPLVALKDAGVALRAGRVTAIVGENGAGKSTLAKIIAGVYRADSGEILIEGRSTTLSGRRQAAMLGIGFVPQSLSFIGTLGALDNHLLAGSSFLLDRPAARRALSETGAALGVEANWDAPVETLSLAKRQLVEIVSAVAHGARALLLDEPTSALGPIEIERLIAALAMLGQAGVAIGLVTHRVREVLEGAQDVTVLRQGEVVFSGAVSGLDGEAVARLMVGERGRARPAPAKATGAARLVVKDLSVGVVLKNVSFEVRAGEIVGVAGVAGPAQPALAEAIAGLRPEAKGQVVIDGIDVTNRAAAARRRGLAYIPEDRGEGAPPDLAVSVVASLLHLGEKAFTRLGMRRRGSEAALCRAIIARFEVRPPRPSLLAGLLSGGNQQKLLVGREIERGPDVIVAHGPTQGLDLAAASSIRAALVEAVAGGAAALVISADLDELLAISSRIIVLAGSRLVAAFECVEGAADAQAFIHRVGEAMTGAKAKEAA